VKTKLIHGEVVKTGTGATVQFKRNILVKDGSIKVDSVVYLPHIKQVCVCVCH
jgi:hypothetical protein